MKLNVNTNQELESINYDEPNKPRLTPDTSIKSSLKSLSGSISPNEKSTVIVVRCWNKTIDDLNRFLASTIPLQQNLTSLKAIIFTINQDLDTDKITTRSVFQISNQLRQTHPFQVFPIEIANTSKNNGFWTSGLNGPISILNLALSAEQKRELSIFYHSFDVHIPEQSATEINQRISNNYPTTTLRVSPQSELIKIIASGHGKKS